MASCLPIDSMNCISSSSHSRGEDVLWIPISPRTVSLSMIGTTRIALVSSAFVKNRRAGSLTCLVSPIAKGRRTSNFSPSLSGSIGICVPRLEGIESSLRHSWFMTSSLSGVISRRSQRSASIILPSSETMTSRKRSSSILVGRSRAKRSMMPSRASCILILRSWDIGSGLSISIFIWEASFWSGFRHSHRMALRCQDDTLGQFDCVFRKHVKKDKKSKTAPNGAVK